jgi:hypothetical protein
MVEWLKNENRKQCNDMCEYIQQKLCDESLRMSSYLDLGLVHPVAPVFNENYKSITFVRNLSCLYCTQTTLHVSAIRPSSGVCYRRVNRTCCLVPQTERCKHIASLHSTSVQLRYTGFLLILFGFTDFSV